MEPTLVDEDVECEFLIIGHRLPENTKSLRPDLPDIDLRICDADRAPLFMPLPDKAPKHFLESREPFRIFALLKATSGGRNQQCAVDVKNHRSDSLETRQLRTEPGRFDSERSEGTPHVLCVSVHPLRKRLSRVGSRNRARTLRGAR